MAESFSKKENSKKRAKKRQDKIIRREDRKINNNKGKSLDDMIVYVDVNGNFTSIPPHLQNRADDLARVKRPHNDATVNTDTVFTGIVTYFNEKGFGFITEDKTRKNVFFHHGQLKNPVNKNDKVNYKKESTLKGDRAIDINIKNN